MPDAEALPPASHEPPVLAMRPSGTHKGQVGRVAIIAGSRGMSGAACLCAAGALRGGAGLVRVCTPASLQAIVASFDPCLMTERLPEDESGCLDGGAVETLAETLGWADVVAIGPGLRVSAGVLRVIEWVLSETKGPLVVDADGLNNLAGAGRWWERRASRQTIVTPHPGEMARLRAGAGLDEKSGDDDTARVLAASEFARQSACVVVLKGRHTVVSNGAAAFINTTGNAGMATGGMGDVLTGLIAAVCGQGLTPFDAARLAVHVHGAAADLAARQIGPVGFLARDVAEAIPAALSEHIDKPRVGYR